MQSRHLARLRANPTIVDSDLEIVTDDPGDLLNDVTDAGFDSRADVHYLAQRLVRGSHIYEATCCVLDIRKVANRVCRPELQLSVGKGLTDDGRNHGSGGLAGHTR